MTNKIKEYIQFAIDNGYYAGVTFTKLKIEKNVKFVYEEADEDRDMCESYSECEWLYILNFIADVWTGYKNITDIITSKPFIEAIARGIIEKTKQIQGEWSFLDLNKIIDEITTEQAIAIRDNKLEEFITNLWIWNN